MIKQIAKRWLAFSLVLVMLVGFMPATAYAAGVNTGVTGLTADSSGNATWSSSNGSITGKATTSEESGCTGPTYNAQTGTLTFTNSSGAVGQLSFDYAIELNGGTATVDGTNVTAGASFSKTLSANETVVVAITSITTAANTTKITISNLKLTAEQDVDVTFKAPSHGSYTVDGTAVTAQTVKTVKTTDSVALAATAASGYKFFGWKNETTGSYLSTSAAFTTSFTEDATVFPEFVAESVPIFQVGSMLYTDLNEAVGYANESGTEKIVLVSNGTLPAGNYTIPSGKTLLIPFDEAQTVYTSTPEVVYAAHVNPSAFRTMTMASGATITVANGGAISVPSKLSAYGTGSGSWNGTPTGKHGRISMNAGSSIDVQSGGKLYAYGYISGAGNVWARSGSEIWECFQIRSWRGGTATTSSQFEDNNVFPLNQYYVQNIEAPVTYYPGATEKVFAAVNMSSQQFGASATFIGSGGMFRLTGGSATKRYTGASDRLELTVDGDFSVSPLSLRITGLPLVGTLDLNTADYVLPIQSNITLNVNSGTTTISQDVAFLPGSEMHIANGATVSVGSGHNAYVYDKDQWGAYAAASLQLVPVGYSTVNGTTAMRTTASLVDARIDVNGTLDLAGNLYTTESGAAIVSIGETGKVVLTAAPGKETTTHQATQSGSDITIADITITPAQLKNADDYDPAFSETSEHTAGETATYVTDHWSWGAKTITYNANVNGQTIADVTQSTEDDQVTLMSFEDEAFAAFVYEGHTFKGWNTKADGTGTSYDDAQADVEITEDLTLYAQWEEEAYVLTLDPDAEPFGYAEGKDERDAVITVTDETVTIPENIYTREGYVFNGWSTVSSNVEDDGRSYQPGQTVARDELFSNGRQLTLYATWNRSYTVTWKNGDAVLETDENVLYNAHPSYDGETPAKAEDDDNFYTFDGWVKDDGDEIVYLADERVTGDVTYTAHFAAEAKIAITFLPGAPEGAAVTGTMPVQKIRSGVDTALNANAFQIEGYSFKHWTDGTGTYANGAPVNFTADTTLTAVWEKNTYTVKLHANDGSAEPEVDSNTVEHGNDFTIPQHQFDRSGYTLIGWSENPAATTATYDVTGTIPNVTRDYDLFAVWQIKTYTITLKANYEGGEDPAALTVGHNEPVTLPEPQREGYGFNGWNTKADGTGIGYDVGDPVAFTADTTLYAQWTPNKYKITFKNGNETLETYQVAYGMMPVYDGAEPVKEGDAQYSYTFAGWDPALTAVTGDAIYTATFTQSINKYTVTFYNEDGTTVLQQNQVEYGTAPSYSGQTPAKPETVQYSYSFAGWKAEDGTEYPVGRALPAVEGTVAYTAYYTETVRTYTVKFFNEGTELQSTQVAYGDHPTYTGTTPEKAADDQYTYTFKGWSRDGETTVEPESVTVNGELNFTALYDKTLNTYTVIWKNGNDVLETDENVPYGETPAYNGETPVKDPTAAETYTFSGWKDQNGADYSADTSIVQGNTTYTAQFAAETRKYTITFENEDGEVLQTGEVAYGETPAYTGETPTKAADAQYSYTFAGWDPALTAVAGDATYTATYTPVLRSYTVTWKNGNDVLETDENVEYGATPSYDGAVPAKESTVSETYSFSGWTPEISEVTGDVTYTAQFESAPRMYTVRFMNGDTELAAVQATYGTTPSYDGEPPEKAADTQFTYEFAGWTKDGEPVDLAAESVSGDATYQARFNAIDIFYTVTWRNWNGVELGKVETYKYGNTIELPDTVVPEHSNENPAKYSYSFDGWIVNGDENNVVKEFGTVTGDVTYTAKFTETINTYTITFKDADGTVLQSSSVAYDEMPAYNGNDPSKPGDAQYSYTFAGWDPALTAVIGDATYTATYEQTVNKYLIKFVNEDGAVLQSSEVEYGTTPAYTGATPAKAWTAQYSYEFAGWDKEIVPVTGIATYTATYTSAVRSYIVTWNNWDGTTLETDTVPYGTVPTYDGATPAKEGDEQFSYVFAGWTPAVSEVTGEETYTATFTEETNSYTVTWYNWDGSTLETDTEVEYGAMPTYDSAIPEKAADAQYTYTFTGWTPMVSTVTGNVTYTATYTPALRSYTVTWVNDDGTTLETDENVDYGTQPSYDGEDPTKAADAQYTYTFSGWTPTVSAVAGNVTYTASYSTEVNKYTVTWIIDGEAVETDVNVPYGAVPEYNGDKPAKASDAQYDYAFSGWTPTVSEVTGNAEYTAVFNETLRQYTVKWVNDVKDENGEYIVLETDLYVPYDTHPSFDSETNPTKAPDAQFTYSFSGEWVVVGQEDVKYDENYKVSGDVTFRAVYSTTVNTYTVIWNNWDGTRLETDENVAYGTTPEYNGANPAREGDAQYGYTWTGGWDQTIAPVTGDVTYTAVFEQTVNTYTVTWLNEDGSVITTDTVAYGETPAYSGEALTKADTLTHSYAFSGWTPEIAAVNGAAEYTAVFTESAKNGWIRWTDNGIYYIDNGTVVTGAARVAYPEDSSFGYAEPAWNDAYDSGHPSDGKSTFLFGEDGKLQTEVNGFYDCSALNSSYPTEWLAVPATVWAINGEIVWHPGLVTDGSNYYYFKTDNSMVKDRDYNVTKVNDQFYTDEEGAHNFVSGGKYSFDADGRIKLLNGFVDDGDVTYYYVYGAKTYAGLIKIGEDYYYVKSDCTVVKGRSYYVGKTNDLLPAGVYSFDAEGKLVMDHKNGIARDENGVLRYYVDGAVQKGTGVVKVGDNYYYVNGSGVVISGRDYAITKTNNLSYTKADGTTAVFEYQKTYTFDENGVMLLNDGFVDADGQTYYYQNGSKTYAGLIKVGDDYYYVKSNCTVVKNCKYYVSKTNGLMAAGSYQFDEDGKMIVPNDGGFTGFKKDDEGVLRYYVKDVMQQNLGLILVEGSYYYINGSGVVASNCDYAVSNTNNLSFTKADGTVVPFESGKVYTFDANGVLQLFDGITDVGGKKIYYVNGVKTYAGLIQIGDDFYYVKSSCELVVDGSYYVSKTNGLKPAGRYSFDAEGKLI